MNDSRHSDISKSRSDRLLEKMVPHVKRFQDRLRDVIENRESGWVRIAIRLKNGVVDQFNNELGEQPIIEDEPDDIETIYVDNAKNPA